jgi:hypothetical protein
MDTHEWDLIEESEGEFSLYVCVNCGAERSDNHFSGEQIIALNGVDVGGECGGMPFDDGELFATGHA